MATPLEPHVMAALFGLLGGITLGLAARIGRFCTLGAVEDWFYGGSDHRMRMWLVAMGVSGCATFGLVGAGVLDLAATPYTAHFWNPIAHLVGGTVFGVGMALAGNCGFGALARLGSGDLRSFVIVVVMGISAYATLSGPLASLRLLVFPPDLIALGGPASLADLAARSTGTPVAPWGITAGLGFVALALSRRSFRAEGMLILWGALVGLVIALGWGATAWLAHESLAATPVESYTFAAPLGETILYAMTSTGSPLSFAVGAVAGVWSGALLGSLSQGHFRWEACEDQRELRRQIFGAAMMGGGAAVALGCTVGQGLSAISVLSFGAPLTFGGIVLGASLGLRSLISGFHPA